MNDEFKKEIIANQKLAYKKKQIKLKKIYLEVFIRK